MQGLVNAVSGSSRLVVHIGTKEGLSALHLVYRGGIVVRDCHGKMVTRIYFYQESPNLNLSYVFVIDSALYNSKNHKK
jgi:hypothetical protein